jgi:iron complex outermembrane recepter protein
MKLWWTCLKTWRAHALTLALVWLTPTIGVAQDTSATLSSTVVDDSGAVVPGATVTVENLKTGLQRRSVTDQQGAALFNALPAGPYRLNVQLAGFVPIGEQDVALTADQKMSIVLKMRLAGVDEAVMVTAQKRGEERLQDVPVPVAVLDAESLANTGRVRIWDYYTRVPSLSTAPNYMAEQRLSIRGITTGGINPSVGVTLDDVPYGATTATGGGQYVPDIDPGDLARIEVLRGPQGALYGANSMGGLIRYVTTDPAFGKFSGRVELGTENTHNGDGTGYNLRASANIPINDAWAMRANLFTRRDAGYIDNPIYGIRGVNRSTAEGARLSALWRPSDRVSLKLAALYQHVDGKGVSEIEVEPGLGDLQQNNLPGTGGYDRTVQAYSGVLQASLGRVGLTSITGYNVNDIGLIFDRSFQFGGFASTAFGVRGVGYNVDRPITKFSQEVRLSSTLGQKTEWLAGLFYTHETSRYAVTATAIDTASQAIVGSLLDFVYPATFDEYAVFGGVTYHVTNRFDIQIGVRGSSNTLILKEWAYIGPYTQLALGRASPAINPRQESSDHAFTYLFTPRFKIAPDFMVYARFASGYRPGGSNAAGPGTPEFYDPDTTNTYEAGAKGAFFGHRLSVDASLYYIDWDDIQITTRHPSTGATFTSNASRAKSAGLELSYESRPLRGLTITGWVAYDNAVLTEDLPPGPSFGVKGDRLPQTPKWSSDISIDQEFPLTNALKGFVGAEVNHVGDRIGVFQSTAVRQALPAFTQGDVRVGVRYATWMASLFVTNVTDERGLINGGLGYLPPNAFVTTRPRTVGLSFTKSF